MFQRALLPMTVVMLSMAMLLGATVTAEATILKNVTDGTVLFADNYEDGPLNATPTETQPQVGTWDYVVNDVLNVDSTEGIAPMTGSQFLRVERSAALGEDQGKIWGLRDPSIDSEADDVIRFETGLYPVSGEISFQLMGDPTPEIVKVSPNANGDIWYRDNGWKLASTTCNGGEWNTVVIEYANGASTFNLSVNGSPWETLNSEGSGVVQMIEIKNNSGESLGYVDAIIPEPGSAALVLIGLVALGLGRRRD